MKQSLRLLLLLLFTATAAVPGWTARRGPVVIERARTLSQREENGQLVQEASGDVWITHDSLSVTCQSASYYPHNGDLIFRRNVEFTDPSRLLLADEVHYNELTEEVYATHRVRIYQDTLSVTCLRAHYVERLNQVYLFDNVRIKEESRKLLLTGRNGFLDHETKYGRVTGDPVLTERDSLGNLVTEITGDTVEFYGQEDLARVSGHVIIVREGLTATGNQLDYFTEEKFAILQGEPQATHGEDELTGDTLRLFFEDEILSQVDVLGHAVATSPADSGKSEPRNRMEGKRMTLWIDGEDVTQVHVAGSAIATYYIREKGRERGLNVTSGDRLFVFFENKEISRIQVIGGTEGKYTPQRLVRRGSS